MAAAVSLGRRPVLREDRKQGGLRQAFDRTMQDPQFLRRLQPKVVYRSLRCRGRAIDVLAQGDIFNGDPKGP